MQREMVIIDTEATGRIELTPRQFDMMLASALVGLDGMPVQEEDEAEADDLWDKLTEAERAFGVAG